MYHFFDTVVQPILTLLKPDSIVEIGCDTALHTNKLLDFCKENGCIFHAVDPDPKFDVKALKSRAGENLVFHRDLSLNALVKIGRADVVLIDGDHNWYTVYNELILIQRLCNGDFPLVILHDVEWPYGRRDCYWIPDSIPDEHRHPFAQKGILPGKNTLVEEGGFNRHLNNACVEQVEKNGVLTAVEDFLGQCDLEIDFIRIPSLFGLGILIPRKLLDRRELADFLEQFRFPEPLDAFLRVVEFARIQLVLSLDKHKGLLSSAEEKGKALEGQRDSLVKKQGATAKKVTELQRKLKETAREYEEKLNQLEKKRSAEADRIRKAGERKVEQLLATHGQELARLKSSLEAEIEQLAESTRQEVEARAEEIEESAGREIESNRQQCERLLSRKDSELADLRKKLNHQGAHWKAKYEKLRQRHQRVLNSEGWKLLRRARKLKKVPVGRDLFKLSRRALGELRLKKHVLHIRRSGLFDAEYYLKKYPEIADLKISPLRHFVEVGWKEGRNPSNSFDTQFYLNSYKEVKAQQTNPLVHYILIGKGKGYATKPGGPAGSAGKQGPAGRPRAKANPQDDALLERIYKYKQHRRARGKARVAIFTSITGGYDVLKQHKYICEDWDYFCVTDRAIAGIYNWEFIQADYLNADPVRTARYYKIHPHVLFPDYEYSIWVDANLDILGDHLKTVVDRLIEEDQYLASVRHPHWNCIYTDAEKCIEYNKDKPHLIREQMELLKKEGYPRENGLFETNVMFRKHNDPAVAKAMNDWWSVINRFSRRDQLSFNYILYKNGLDCAQIFDEPDTSTRTHSHYRYHLHGESYNESYPPYRAPYFNQGLPKIESHSFDYSSSRPFDLDLGSLADKKIDVIVPVFNALEDVKACLQSIEAARGELAFQLVVADDASDAETRDWLAGFSEERAGCIWSRRRENLGYTRNINQAVAESQADFIVLLNSDTLVSQGWLEKLLWCAYSADDIGLVGPLSNAASWQSLPRVEDENGQLVVNQLPEGMSIERVNELLEERNLHPLYPRVHLLNGFCLGIKREVFNEVGYFDEFAFPRGYGEEDDFCLRAGEAGFTLAVATHTYIYHAKSKSFGAGKRQEIVSESWRALKERYGQNYLKNAIESSKQHPGLVNLRSLFEQPGESVQASEQRAEKWSSIEVPSLLSSYRAPESQGTYERQAPTTCDQHDVRLVAFYLPQFYPFKKNDEVWGKGFTEWTNVTRALPLFKGHHQPKLPDALGFYDTRLKETLAAQVELAKQHGIHGFCFHHYFFKDQPVMRVPFNLFLDNPDLDMPFCLHWANEPWTTTWSFTYMDKSKDQIIYDQEHNEDNDLAFIRDARRALLDPRYMRVRGRPLLLIYRPGLFPDIKQTLERWRRYCVDEGIGDLHLAMVQTNAEGERDPRELGFDAAVEFPPHLVDPVYVHKKMEFFVPNFDGAAIDLPSVAKASLAKQTPEYVQYRGLFPRWDNTPRKIRGTSIYVNDSPEQFQAWLEGLIRHTQDNLPADEAFVFINAWNEWAEGAFLEPDRKYGYAYLNACGRALERTERKPFLLREGQKIGIQIHAFHLDEFERIYRCIFDNFSYPADLLISVSDEKMLSEVGSYTSGYKNGEVIIRKFENRGRDIAPMVVGFGDLVANYTYMLHLHTKKSDYSSDLGGWLDHLLDRLIGSREVVQENLSRLAAQDVGIVFPAHYDGVKGMIKWGANLEKVNELLSDTDIVLSETDKPVFPSGSMFFFRPDALSGLFSKGLTFADFSAENGQRDGTLAHAIERSFCYFAESRGYGSIVVNSDEHLHSKGA